MSKSKHIGESFDDFLSKENILEGVTIEAQKKLKKTRETTYPALVHKTETSIYGISFPDFLGCVSGVENQEDIIKMATEALNAHIELIQEDGDPIPTPSEIISITKNDLDDDLVAVILVPIIL